MAGALTGDKRSRPRRRTRLRSGKIADAEGRFIAECAVHDQSAGGARLRLLRSVSVPDCFLLYDDERSALFAAATVWRNAHEIGVRLKPAPGTVEAERIARALAGRYYAL